VDGSTASITPLIQARDCAGQGHPEASFISSAAASLAPGAQGPRGVAFAGRSGLGYDDAGRWSSRREFGARRDRRGVQTFSELTSLVARCGLSLRAEASSEAGPGRPGPPGGRSLPGPAESWVKPAYAGGMFADTRRKTVEVTGWSDRVRAVLRQGDLHPDHHLAT